MFRWIAPMFCRALSSAMRRAWSRRHGRRAQQQLLELRFMILNRAAVHLEHVSEAQPALITRDLHDAEFRLQQRFGVGGPGAEACL